MLLIILSLLFGFPVHPVHPYAPKHPIGRVLQDSLPPLHTLAGKNISKIETSFEKGTIQVTMTDGRVLLYLSADWDYEDYYPEINPKLKKAINQVKKTFIRAEQMPEFPGKTEGWDKYLKEFCLRNQKEIQNNGPETLLVVFNVHLKGQVSDLDVILTKPDLKLSDLAKECIKSGPPWLPAVQNGHPVVCQASQIIKFSAE